MLSDASSHISNGHLSEGIEVDASIESVIEFIEQHFNEFAENQQGEIATSEVVLTDKLCKFLNRKAGAYPFYFHHENVENPNGGYIRQTDIGTLSESEEITVGDRIYGEYDSFFSMEAKRLPPPGNNREKEYVIGNDRPSGGIERFKKGIHGANLKYAAMIGYIQRENKDHWFLQINTWIAELANGTDVLWHLNDQLRMLDFENESLCHRLESNNSRKIENAFVDDIKLLHFWINLIQ